jgi:hypothetical protein
MDGLGRIREERPSESYVQVGQAWEALVGNYIGLPATTHWQKTLASGMGLVYSHVYGPCLSGLAVRLASGLFSASEAFNDDDVQLGFGHKVRKISPVQKSIRCVLTATRFFVFLPVIHLQILVVPVNSTKR